MRQFKKARAHHQGLNAGSKGKQVALEHLEKIERRLVYACCCPSSSYKSLFLKGKRGTQTAALDAAIKAQNTLFDGMTKIDTPGGLSVVELAALTVIQSKRASSLSAGVVRDDSDAGGDGVDESEGKKEENETADEDEGERENDVKTMGVAMPAKKKEEEEGEEEEKKKKKKEKKKEGKRFGQAVSKKGKLILRGKSAVKAEEILRKWEEGGSALHTYQHELYAYEQDREKRGQALRALEEGETVQVAAAKNAEAAAAATREKNARPTAEDLKRQQRKRRKLEVYKPWTRKQKSKGSGKGKGNGKGEWE